ncbi:6-phosphogluconate dehydrogenase C-terminal domain-like protein [Schizopora paradoxa]|uniref:6-phosphogluconate dehydrogenase C-terminal domain-like protein n=1 Tax=Schizopora paradoxa TaxID=27342 RepID=A0A0H2REE9_9AGAM|nr:6-phosphogluconate dehydrogenase C-terminal domain-like protein [Schizopora paradoxa]
MCSQARQIVHLFLSPARRPTFGFTSISHVRRQKRQFSMASGDKLHEICVVGFGAIGAIYGLALDRSRKTRVTAVCRSNYEVLKKNGLDYNSVTLGVEKGWRPHRFLKSCEDAADRKYDSIVCCFKTLADIQTTPEVLGSLIDKSNTFILLQNGVGIEQDLRNAVPNATIISGCAWIDATAVDGGKRVDHFSLEKLTLGIHRREPKETQKEEQAALDLFVNLLRSGGANPDPREDINVERWRKVLWSVDLKFYAPFSLQCSDCRSNTIVCLVIRLNASHSTLCTLARAPVREFFTNKALPYTEVAIRGLMHEVLRVARAAGVTPDQLPDTAIDETYAVSYKAYAEDPTGERVPSAFRPSMLVDLDLGRPMEVEAIVGGVIRKARECGVQTPQLDLVYASLKVIQAGIIAAKAK